MFREIKNLLVPRRAPFLAERRGGSQERENCFYHELLPAGSASVRSPKPHVHSLPCYFLEFAPVPPASISPLVPSTTLYSEYNHNAYSLKQIYNHNVQPVQP